MRQLANECNRIAKQLSPVLGLVEAGGVGFCKGGSVGKGVDADAKFSHGCILFGSFSMVPLMWDSRVALGASFLEKVRLYDFIGTWPVRG